MTLGITKAYSPTSGQVANSTSYNTDIAALFNAFSGLEGQTSTLGGLTITPTTNSTTVFKITNASGTELLSADTSGSLLKLKSTTKLSLNGSTATSYLTESSAGVVDLAGTTVNIKSGSSSIITADATTVTVAGATSITSTALALLVSSSITTNYASQIINTSKDSGGLGLLITVGPDNNAGTNVHIKFGDGDNTQVGLISSSSGTTTYATSSDIRLKEDVQDTTFGLVHLKALKVKDFKFKKYEGRKVGLMAQEVFDIYPIAVSKPNTDDGEWGIDYGKFTPLLIKSVQELATRIEALEAK